MTLPSNAARRMGPVAVLNGLSGLYMPALEWKANSGVDPSTVGFQAFADLTPTGRLYVLQDIFVDIGEWREIRIVRMPPNTVVPADSVEVLAEVVFDDTHPPEWVEQLTDAKAAFVTVGDQPPGVFATIGEWLDTTHLAVVPVAQWVSDDGVGVARGPAEDPGPTRHLTIEREDLALGLRWLREGVIARAEGPLHEVTALDPAGRLRVLGALVLTWSHLASGAVTSGAYDSGDAAATASIDAAREIALDSGVGPDLLDKCVGLATAQTRGNSAEVGATCEDLTNADGATYAIASGFFMQAQLVLLQADAAAQGRSVGQLLDQVQSQVAGTEDNGRDSQ